MKKVKLCSLFISMMLQLFSFGAAHAALSAVGPTDANHGFPVWYQDANGLTLELCVPDTTELQDSTCLLLPADVPNPANPIVFPTNFPGELFWWSGGATIDLPGGGSADLVLALEAAFLNEAPIQGDQVAFGRVRIRIDAPEEGTYTVTHPYGTHTFEVDDPGVRSINFTDDMGIGLPGDFTLALGSRIGPFLRPAVAAGGAPLDFVVANGKTYIIDPAIVALGDTTPVTGGTNGNIFRVQGPNIGGQGVNSVQTDQFSLTGRVFTGVPLNIDRATYGRSAAGETVNVWATVAGPLGTSASVTATVPGASASSLAGDGGGRFFGHMVFPAGTLLPVPQQVTVTGSNAGNTDTVLSRPLQDVVSLTQVTYNVSAKVLTINASSSDKAVPPALTATGLGNLPGGALTLSNVVVPPIMLEVTSAAGGVEVRTTEIVAALSPSILVSPVGVINSLTPSYVWNEILGATQYQLFVSNSAGVVRNESFNAATVCSAGVCTASTTNPLTNNTTYFWNVRGVNPLGYGPWAGAKSFTVTTATIPAAPVMTAPIGTIATATPNYTWNESPGATQYQLFVSNSAGIVINESFSAAAICSTGVCTVPTTTPLTAATTYYWNVRASNFAGSSPWAGARSFFVQ